MRSLGHRGGRGSWHRALECRREQGPGWVAMAKVYVSSTIADLKRERRAVMDWLVAAGHQPVHSYQPNSDTVRDSCLDDVDTCDLYVLILGHRYGFRPAEDNPEGLSITHLEFRRAGQSGIPRIALLRTSIPDVSLSDLADPQRLALVSAFREEVAREVRPAEFSDRQGLIQGLSTGVQAELAKLGLAARWPVSRSPSGGPGAAAGAAADVPGRAGGAARRAGCPAGGGEDDGAAGGGAVRAGRRGQDQRGAGVRPPAPGRGRGGLAVPRRGPDRAGGRFRRAGRPARRRRSTPGTRWPRCTGCWPPSRRRGCWCSTTRRTGPRCSGSCRRPGTAGCWSPAGTRSGRPARPWRCRSLTCRSPRSSWSTARATRTGRLRPSLPVSWAGCRWRWSRPPPTFRPPADSLAGYLASFRQRRAEMLGRGEPTGYGKTVATTWTLAFEGLSRPSRARPGCCG